MEETSTIVQDNGKKAQSRQKIWYDQNTSDRELKPADEVLVLLPTISNKLLAQWQGPCDVLHKTGKVNYEIDMKDRKKDLSCKYAEKWHQPDAKSFWTTEEVESAPEEEESIPTWKGECT